MPSSPAVRCRVELVTCTQPMVSSESLVERSASPPAVTVKVTLSAVQESFPLMPWLTALTVIIPSYSAKVSLLVMPLLALAVTVREPEPCSTRSALLYRQALGSSSAAEENASL